MRIRFAVVVFCLLSNGIWLAKFCNLIVYAYRRRYTVFFTLAISLLEAYLMR